MSIYFVVFGLIFHSGQMSRCLHDMIQCKSGFLQDHLDITNALLSLLLNAADRLKGLWINAYLTCNVDHISCTDSMGERKWELGCYARIARRRHCRHRHLQWLPATAARAQEVPPPSKLSLDVANGVEGGAGAGVVLGGAGGLLAGLGLLAIPGIGPVVAGGWLLATAAGAAAGAILGGAAGGIIGALVAGGVPEADAHVYSEAIRRGGSLVTAKVTPEQIDQAKAHPR